MHNSVYGELIVNVGTQLKDHAIFLARKCGPEPQEEVSLLFGLVTVTQNN